LNPDSIPVTELLPHGPEMTLIDKLVESSADRSVGIVTITTSSEFVESGGVPSWVGIEYMAQTIAARVGYDAYLRGESPPVGLLLGTRNYSTLVSEFAIGSELRIIVKPLFVESGFGSFTCTIKTDAVVAEAVLNTYQPTNEVLADITGE